MGWTRAASGDAVEGLLRERYATRMHTREPHRAMALTNLVTGPISLGRGVFDLTVDLRGEVTSMVGVGRSRAGRISHTVDGDELRWARGDVFLAVDPTTEYVAHLDHADVDHTMIDVAVFRDVAGLAPDAHVRWTGRAAVSPHAAGAWQRTCNAVRGLVDTAHPVPPLVVGAAARLLASVALSTFPNDAVRELVASDRRDAHPSTLRRAVAFIETHPDLDLSTADVARAAHVSARAVQLAFRRHLDTTPLAYLRRVRLDRAHADLLAATAGDGTTVTTVAARWGWARPGRFAATYTATYGRHPSDVLGDGARPASS